MKTPQSIQRTRRTLLSIVLAAGMTAQAHGQEMLTAQDLINIQIQAHMGNTEPGKQIIDFNFADLTGKFHTPVTYRGDVLLLWMIGYINDTSVALASEMEALRMKYRDDPVTLLALDLWNGTHEQLSNFKTITQVQMPLLLNALSDEFPFAVDSSTMVVVDKDGIVQGIFGSEDFAGIERMIGLILEPAPALEYGPQSLFYGSTVEVATEVKIPITITNGGTLDLLVTGIQSDIPGMSFSQEELTLTPRATATVDAILIPTQEGTIEGTVTISTNDPAAASVQLPVSPSVAEAGDPPQLAQPEGLTLGDIEVGRSGTATLVIRNDGPGALIVTDLQTDIEGIAFSSTSFTVLPGDSTTVSVTVQPTTAGDLSGTLQVVSNDPVNALLSVSLQAVGVVIPADPRTDFDGSGTVDFTDFLEFAAAFGSTDGKYDLDGDGTVGFADFLTFAENFGKSTGS